MNIKDLKVSFEHTTAELELILAGLRKLPMELVQKLHDEIILKANAEVSKQITPTEVGQEATPIQAEINVQ